jgi:hypothetical protein
VATAAHLKHQPPLALRGDLWLDVCGDDEDP